MIMAKRFLMTSFAFLAITVLLKDKIAVAKILSGFATLMTGITNYRSTSGALSEFSAMGVTVCARECSLTTDCESFFYNTQDKLCQLHDIVFKNNGPNLTYVSQTYHYRMNALVPTFPCPLAPPGVSYNVALLQDNTVFTYRVVWNFVDRIAADAACMADGARLVRVLTLAKMQALVTLFTTCPGYNHSGNYWIDGSNINATDVYDITQWTTSDGEPLPTTNQFWAPDWPLDTEIHHCVALWSDSGDGWSVANTPLGSLQNASVVPTFTCPLAPPGVNYNVVLLQDNTVFTYRVVWDYVERFAADAACMADGARLVKVLTLAKMQALVTLFTTCPGGNEYFKLWRIE
ncbi:uncharacterized protein LOC123535122 [Mercenaria mercenaria]|uniref:uncharacterized protein LOC123535122 n=1 Tax=Mercenaria mercenaria TaxID=6596 RepID=UPI00234F0429|nr:uncharacterized protein LOC123535122 [Mercenaria mercenaria]